MKQYKIKLYTDGAAKGNPGAGGYGVILEWKTYRKEISAGYRLTTNNRMELLAVIVGLEAIKTENAQVTVYSDSRYVVDAIEKNWIQAWIKKHFKKVKNPDLWKRLIPLLQKHNVQFVWIKGHNNHPQNERCDQLAVQASQLSQLLIDKEYEDSKKDTE